MATVPFSLRIDTDIRTQLENEAKTLDRSASYVAIKAIEEYLQARQHKREAIERAVQKAEQGVFVSQEAATAWVDSWGTDKVLPKPKPDIFPDQS